MRKIKMLAPFLMLLSGLIASVMMFFYQYEKKQMLLILVLVMVIFYLIGALIQRQVNQFIQKYEEEEAERKAKEGEVIEKQAADEQEAEMGREQEALKEHVPQSGLDE